MSLLGEYFVSLSAPVVSREEVFGGVAGICYCYSPSVPVLTAGPSFVSSVPGFAGHLCCTSTALSA